MQLYAEFGNFAIGLFGRLNFILYAEFYKQFGAGLNIHFSVQILGMK